MSRKPMTTEQILTALAEAPACIAGITAGLTEAQFHASPSEGE